MTSIATAPPAPAFRETGGRVRDTPARRGPWRRWLGALFAIVLCSPALLALPPVWHGAVRSFLGWQASRCGYALSVERVAGGPFGATDLDGLRLRQNGADPAAVGGGTDLSVRHARFVLAWGLPFFRRSAPWAKEICLSGVCGQCDLAPGPLPHHASEEAARWLPTNFAVQADELRLRQGDCELDAAGLLVSGRGDGAGGIDAREVRMAGPGFAGVFTDWHGQTVWRANRLTLTGLRLGEEISLATATLDFSRLRRRRLDWDCDLRAPGGEVRGQGTVDFTGRRVVHEIAATLRHTALAPLARTVGVRAPVDGLVEQASFTFHGEPENLASAQMWLSARATGFHWGDRRWQSLDLQAVVVNRRVQLHRLDLRQDGNNLSLAGEFPLPTGEVAGLVWTGDNAWWQAAGFSCSVDARLEDLHALAELVGPGLHDLAGRMSVNGRLTAAPGHPEIEGYLNVEGTRLEIRGAPLDFLRSTVLFRGGAMEIADLQATHDADYFTAHGVIGLCREHADRYGELRAEVRDMNVYAAALAGWPGIGERAASVRRLDAVLRLEDGKVVFDRWEGAPAATAPAASSLAGGDGSPSRP